MPRLNRSQLKLNFLCNCGQICKRICTPQPSPRVVLLEVVLPASVPLLIAGVRIGLAAGWMALIAAEIVAGDGASSGLGYLILVGQRTLQANLTIGAMLVIGLLGAAIDYGVRRLERRVVTWQ